MVTDRPNIILGILAADCVPVLFVDPHKRIIGAAHAGWKPAIGGIINETVQTMQMLGARSRDIVAAIGPAIAQSSYEVGPEFFERFLQESDENIVFFTPSPKKSHKFFDIKAYVARKLAQSGVASVNILANDTCSEENLFFSFRRATLRGEPDYGRQISAICLTQ